MKETIAAPTGEERKILSEFSSKGEQESQRNLDASTPLGVDAGELQKRGSSTEKIGGVPNTGMGKFDRLKKRLAKEWHDLALILSKIDW
jgi:hypothetical protein